MTYVDNDDAAIAALGSSAEVEALSLELAQQGADTARVLAPKLTGAGAASIHAEVEIEDGIAVGKFGWDAAHGYMRFAEDGTEHEPARPFIRPAGDSIHL